MPKDGILKDMAANCSPWAHFQGVLGLFLQARILSSPAGPTTATTAPSSPDAAAAPVSSPAIDGNAAAEDNARGCAEARSRLCKMARTTRDRCADSIAGLHRWSHCPTVQQYTLKKAANCQLCKPCTEKSSVGQQQGARNLCQYMHKLGN